MSISKMGLRTTIYKVAALEQAKVWYASAFQTDPYFDEPGYVGFNIGGYELGLLTSDLPPESKTANVCTYWGVEDIDKEIARLVALGAVVTEAPTNVGGPIMVAMVTDPWGNALGLIYNPTFKLG